MVRGLVLFRDRFEQFSDCCVLIGGAASQLVMNEGGAHAGPGDRSSEARPAPPLKHHPPRPHPVPLAQCSPPPQEPPPIWPAPPDLM